MWRGVAAALQTFAGGKHHRAGPRSRRPLAPLRHGGIGAREVSRVAKACRVESEMGRLVLDLAYAAQLWCGNHRLHVARVTREWRDLAAGTGRSPADAMAL